MTTKTRDLAKSFEKLKLILDLETNADSKTVLGQSILSAIQGKKYSNDEILAFVADQAKDSPGEMAKVIGSDLVTRIINYSK